MEPEFDSDSEEKKDTILEVQAAEAMNKEKAKGEKPMDRAIGTGVELITQKAKGIVIDVVKVLKSDTLAGTKRSRGKQIENVVKSCYSLRSGLKRMDVEVKPTMAMAGRKRKGKEKRTVVWRSPETDTEEACKRIRRGRNNDDGTDDMGGTRTGARTT